jgi:dihydroneopterin aldolase
MQLPSHKRTTLQAFMTRHGLKKVSQVKKQILWINLQKLILLSAGNTPDNKKAIKYYDDIWREVP